MAKNSNKPKLYKSIRGSYIPITWVGWLTYLPFIGYLLFSLKVVSDQSASLSLKIISVFVQWVVATLVMTVIARSLS